ncbi:helicase [Aureococcus anophagefferens]|nr:helicase [Aureococcus anophagefferens]
MSRAAHDAVRSHLDLGGEEVSAGAAAQLVRECKTDRQAAAALAAAHDGVVRAGFSAADASRALACVAARRGARASLARHALDWLCLRLDHGSLPRAFREDDEDERKGPDTSHVTLDIVAATAPGRRARRGRGANADVDDWEAAEDEAADAADDDGGAADRKAFALRYAAQLAEAEVAEARREAKARSASRAGPGGGPGARRRGLPRGRPGATPPATGAGAAPDDDDDAVGDLFAAAEAAAAVAPPVEHAPAAPARAVEPAVVWSGATPREKLDQWCRERGNPKPQYEVASKATLRCRVWAPQRERIQKKNARKAKGCAAVGPPTLVAGQDKRAKFPTSKPHISAVFHSLVATADVGDAMLDPWARSRACPGGASGAGRDFAATKALYALSPELPLPRAAPPFGAGARGHGGARRRGARRRAAAAARRGGAPPPPTDAWEDPAPATDSWEDLLSSDDEARRPRRRRRRRASPRRVRRPRCEAPRAWRRLKQTKAGDEWKAWWLARKRSKGYSAMRETRSALPAAKSRGAFVGRAAFAASPSATDGIVVCGETGSGKTTQLPHFILDSGSAPAACGRPTCASSSRSRGAAASVARRRRGGVRRDDVGGLVGYHIRHERRVSSRTKLLFCTAGVLLRMLRASRTARRRRGGDGGVRPRATHIILDEVHERAADSDLLLAALRRALFQKYLDTGTGKAATPTPVLSISGRAHPVAEYFLEDVVAARGTARPAAGFAESGPGPSVRVARRDGGDDGRLERAMARYRDEEAEPHSGNARLDYELVVAAIESVVDGDFADGAGDSDDAAGGDARRAAGAGTSTLVFLPGVAEIRRVADLLRGGRRFADGFVVAELHANAARDEQRKAFDPAPPGCRKVVLATNVAELRGYPASRPSSTAAASRSREHYDCRLADHQEPELMRVPLEELLLSVKLACDGARRRRRSSAPAEWLGECPQPPPTHALSAALSELVSVGALAHAVEGEDDSWAAMEASLGAGSDASLALTPLGRHLARLPVHPRLGKMLVYGTLFGCVGPRRPWPRPSARGALERSPRPDAASQRRGSLAPPRADLVAAGRALDAYRGEPGQRGRAALARELGLHEPAVRGARARQPWRSSARALDRGASGRRDAPANRHAANANGDDGAAIRGAAVELSVPRVASARAAGDADAPAAGAAPRRKAVKFDRAKLSPSSFLALADLDAAACHVAFFSRRWDTNRSKLLLGGCAVATPFALLLMYPGDLEVRHARERRRPTG